LLFAVVAQLLDALTFAFGSQMIGIRYESNALMAAIYHRQGLDGVLLVKGTAILATLAVLTILAGRVPRAFTIGASAAVGFGLLGLLTNTTTVSAIVG
jgi:hypothetical protein